jgi:hypothetical protein
MNMECSGLFFEYITGWPKINGTRESKKLVWPPKAKFEQQGIKRNFSLGPLVVRIVILGTNRNFFAYFFALPCT